MRILLAVAFVVVTSVAAFTYRDLILKEQGVGSGTLLVTTASAPQTDIELDHSPLPTPVSSASVTVDSIMAIDALSDEFITAVQQDPLNVPAMIDLALLYMKNGWFDRAIGPLARAREVAPASEEVRQYLELAMARAGGVWDLNLKAREFEALVEMWGMGC